MLQRLIGVITLNRHTYREIAEDKNGTTQAAIVVIVVTIIVGIISALGVETQVPGLTATTRSPLGSAILAIISQLLIWLVGSWVIARVVIGFFHGNTDTGEMLRVFGYTRVFQILFVLGVFGSTLAAIASIAGLILGIIGVVIGIREASDFSTGKAFVAGAFAIVLVSILIAFIVAFVFTPIVTTLLPT